MLEELTKKFEELEVKVVQLELESAKVSAPTWFVKEFGSADLNGLIDTPIKSNDFWETTAVVLRAVKA